MKNFIKYFLIILAISLAACKPATSLPNPEEGGGQGDVEEVSQKADTALTGDDLGTDETIKVLRQYISPRLDKNDCDKSLFMVLKFMDEEDRVPFVENLVAMHAITAINSRSEGRPATNMCDRFHGLTYEGIMGAIEEARRKSGKTPVQVMEEFLNHYGATLEDVGFGEIGEILEQM